MTGISEILVLVLLIACILILPRMFKGEPSKKTSSLPPFKKLPVKKRVYIVLSIIYPIAVALYLKPSNDNFITYISIGISPVLFFWAIVWIMAGREK